MSGHSDRSSTAVVGHITEIDRCPTVIYSSALALIEAPIKEMTGVELTVKAILDGISIEAL